MRRIAFVASLLVAVAGTAGTASAQASPGARAPASIDPGMTRDQVVAKLGKPASEHSSGTKTYLYYANGREKSVGMSDMVAIEDGKVVDAVFRSGNRKYTGTSSSPRPISAEAAIVKGGGKPSAKPMKMPPPPTKQAPEVKKSAPPAKVAPAGKAVPPTKKLAEPAKTIDAKKIQAPVKKSADSAKKSAPAPAKKP
jgi:outer membrane protein assembly factor BamE (lipoprotein component of BamABCDE complex)